MNSKDLFERIKEKKSFLCIGLDVDYNNIPKILTGLEYPIFEFNKRIIDKTYQYAVAYKPNTAFYETMGTAGWINLEMTVNYIREQYPDIFLIADAKRGDIGNTSKMYAQAFLKNLDFDAITITPYMGEDSVKPYFSFKDKWVIILALTSNTGAQDFQFTREESSKDRLFEIVIKKSLAWGNADNMMYVIGATQAAMLTDVRKIVPNHFLLIPGIGTQGGDLKEVVKYGMNNHCGLLVNSSRSIIYADCTDQFANAASQKALELQKEMETHLKQKGII
jgi:orotidine-5'-phosphate decarboxylase